MGPETIITPMDNRDVLIAGLTKREYFAGLAMQGYLAHPKVDDTFLAAEWAVKAADALLAELAKEKP